MAVMVLLAIALGLVSAYLPAGQQPRQGLLEIHKALGLTVLVLVIIRIAYRLFRGEPPYREALDPLTHRVSRLAHAALYALMLFMPLSGYIYSAAGGYSLPWFGLFHWPRLLPQDKNLSLWGEWLHDKAAWIAVGVVALHIIAVVWHVTIKRDDVLARMRGG
jgi:cytochrome b561